MAPSLFSIIGWVAFALNVAGNLMLTGMTNRGHAIRLCSNACWLIYAPATGAWALFANHCTFAVINVIGYVRWHRRGNMNTSCDNHHRVECRVCREYVSQCGCHGGRAKTVTLGGPCGICLRQMTPEEKTLTHHVCTDRCLVLTHDYSGDH
jgi:hypothetical protein